MKITLKLYQPNAPGVHKYVDAAYHEDLAGVTTHKSRGEFQVKSITSISVHSDDSLTIYAEPIDRDLIPPSASHVAAFNRVMSPIELVEAPSPYVPGCEPLEEPSF